MIKLFLFISLFLFDIHYKSFSTFNANKKSEKEKIGNVESKFGEIIPIKPVYPFEQLLEAIDKNQKEIGQQFTGMILMQSFLKYFAKIDVKKYFIVESNKNKVNQLLGEYDQISNQYDQSYYFSIKLETKCTDSKTTALNISEVKQASVSENKNYFKCEYLYHPFPKQLYQIKTVEGQNALIEEEVFIIIEQKIMSGIIWHHACYLPRILTEKELSIPELNIQCLRLTEGNTQQRDSNLYFWNKDVGQQITQSIPQEESVRTGFIIRNMRMNFIDSLYDQNICDGIEENKVTIEDNHHDEKDGKDQYNKLNNDQDQDGKNKEEFDNNNEKKVNDNATKKTERESCIFKVRHYFSEVLNSAVDLQPPKKIMYKTSIPILLYEYMDKEKVKQSNETLLMNKDVGDSYITDWEKIRHQVYDSDEIRDNDKYLDLFNDPKTVNPENNVYIED